MATNTPTNKQGFKPPTTPAKKATPTITAGDSSGRGFALAIAALIIVGLAAVAFLATSRDSDIADGPQVADVTVEGDALPNYPTEANVSVTDASNDPAVGTTAPTLIGTNFDDEEITIGPDGRPKAVYFLAHFCQFCQNEVPVVQNLIDTDQQPEGIDLYAVSTGVNVENPGPNYPPETWLNRENWTVPTVRDDGASSAFNLMGGQSFPYVIYLDGENNVLTRSAGQLDESITLALWNNLAAGAVSESVDSEGDNSTEADSTETETETE